MGDPLAEQATARPPRIVDLVFAGEPIGGGRRLAFGSLMVVAIYAAMFTAIGHFGRSAGPWSAEMAARVHDAIVIERAVEDTPPPPPAVPTQPETSRTEAPRVARTARAAHARPAPPAQAGQLAAASSAPVDFTDSAFVVGSGTSYAGGTTTSTATSRAPAHGNIATAGAGDGSANRTRARSVALDQAAWNCPWPAEADAQQVNEQTVVLRAAVGADGHADRVEVLSDPGFGFGAAARLCALRTRFEPARDPAGQAIAALTPPIRVHFFR